MSRCCACVTAFSASVFTSQIRLGLGLFVVIVLRRFRPTWDISTTSCLNIRPGIGRSTRSKTSEYRPQMWMPGSDEERGLVFYSVRPLGALRFHGSHARRSSADPPPSDPTAPLPGPEFRRAIQSLGEAVTGTAGAQLTKRARLDGEGERFTLRGRGQAPLASQPALRTPLREAASPIIGHFRAIACQCVNQKRREFVVGIRLAPQPWGVRVCLS
jgi:hypothetical protein